MSEAGELNGLDDDYGLDDVDRFSETGVETHAYQEESTEDAARKQWLEQPWEQKWKEVLKLLAASQVRWDQSGDSHLTILEDYKKESLVSKNPYGATRPTVLHELAKDFECSDFHKIPVETQLKVMRFLLQHMQQRAPTEGFNQIQQEDPILEVAMLTDNHALLHYLTEKCTDSLVELLDAHGQSGMNPLHYAFRTHLADALKHVETVRREKLRPVKKNLTLSVFLKLLRKFILNAKAETVVAQDSAGNTTIHYALGYDLCRLENSFYMDKIVRPLVEKGDTIFLKRQHARQFNKAEQSPYLYYEHTEKTWKREHHVPIRTSVTKSRYYDEGKGPEDSKREPLVADTRMGDDKRRAKELAGKGETEYRDMSLVQDPKLTRKEKQNATQHGVADKMLEAHGPLRSTDKSISSPVMGKGADTVSFTKRNVSSLVPPQNTLMMTATQSRAPKSVGEASNGDKQSATKIDPQIAAANIHTYLKLHYIRTRADMEAKELLYGKVASDKNMYFDATHQQGKTAAELNDLIEKLSRAGGFEDALSYVNLPFLNHISDNSSASTKPYNSNEGRQRITQDGPQENPKIGRTSLVSVFDKLAEKGISHILRLMVDDMETPSHTDGAIERAIRGRDSFSLGTRRNTAIEIETWDWRKLDMSIDVILFASPKIVNVNLYWSGNWAVLNGWICPSGIPRLWRESGETLKSVTLHASPGIESFERTRRMIEHFKAEIKKATEDKIKVESNLRTHGRMSSKSDDELGSLSGGRSDGPRPHDWIDRMEQFRSALFAVHAILKIKGLTPPRIKVALIDDGVDLSSLDTYNNVVQATGLSYCPPSGKTERPWHQSTNGHGTIMANMIVRINPWVSLDVMRIQDSIVYKPGVDGGMRTIDPFSAAKAIDGARIRKADIISMSWSIRKLVKTKVSGMGTDNLQTAEEKGIKALQDAIDRARADNILMFCSAADNIQMVGKDSLPFSRAPDYIFRIGAALPKGQRDPASEDVNSISYFFPGNQVADTWNPRSAKTVQYHDGSSVSTALAAGLSSLIMYCTIVVRDYSESTANGENQSRRDVEKRESWVKKLRIHDNMRKAFDNINQKDNEDKKFLPVWHVFGNASDTMKNLKGEKVLEELDDLVTRLCSNLEAE